MTPWLVNRDGPLRSLRTNGDAVGTGG